MQNSSITLFKAFPIAFLLSAISLGSVSAQWVPPEDPDPEEIRRAADNDAREERFELASQKYTWYYEEALTHQLALVGVRNSFALFGWMNLANQYPPALEEMKRARDGAEERVRSNIDDSSAFEDIEIAKGALAFHDAASLNRVLREDSRTIALFKWLDQHDPDFAHLTYIVAQDVLVEAKEFALCETYLTGRNSFDEILKGHQGQLNLMEKLYGGAENVPHIDSHFMMLARKAAYIVAILVNRDRLSDAKIVAEKAIQELDDGKLRDQINDALQGTPPERLL